MFSQSFKSQKLRVNLRLAINRLKLLEKKKTEMAMKARREIADYLQQNKDDRARIRVEHIIREDYIVEAMEILELYCDLLLARMGLIETLKHCEEGLQEAVSTLIWAAPRLQSDVQELRIIQDQLMLKYGREFAEQAIKNTHNTVNEKTIIRLSPTPPPKSMVENYLIEIARNYNVRFEPDQSVFLAEGIPSIDSKEFENIGIDSRGPGGPGGASGGSGPGNIGFSHFGPGPGSGSGGLRGPLPDIPNIPSVPPVGPGVGSNSGQTDAAYPPPHLSEKSYPPPGMSQQPPYPPPSYSAPPYPGQQGVNGPASSKPTAPSTGVNSLPDLPQVPADSFPSVGGNSNAVNQNGGGEDVDFDDLTRRFEELKKKK